MKDFISIMSRSEVEALHSLLYFIMFSQMSPVCVCILGSKLHGFPFSRDELHLQAAAEEVVNIEPLQWRAGWPGVSIISTISQ